MSRWKQTFIAYLLLLEAFLFLGISRLLVLLLPFRYIVSLFGVINRETSCEPMHHHRQGERIGRILAAVSRRLPWRSMCLEQALAGLLMLKRRRWEYTIYFGVQKKTETLEAHAWLRSGDQMITGAAGHEAYTVIFTIASR